jgi:hypothetical protein
MLSNTLSSSRFLALEREKEGTLPLLLLPLLLQWRYQSKLSSMQTLPQKKKKKEREERERRRR